MEVRPLESGWHGRLSRSVDVIPRGVQMASEVRFADVHRVVRRHGWVVIRVRGSHHVFKKPDGSIYALPVHHGKVKPFYWREIKKQIGED
jgi:predicted RNA binding protein YcfA (HicA-like mRNA interferase family)